MKTILHVVPSVDEANGVYHVARLLAGKQRAEGHEACVVSAVDFSRSRHPIPSPSEVWVHGMWLPVEWRAMWRVVRRKNVKLVRMTHGSLSPVYLERQSKWKKRLVRPIEGWYFARCDRVVTTCAAETAWCRCAGVKAPVEQVDMKAFFELGGGCETAGREARPERSCPTLHVMYLGRRHPLKGVDYLEQAVAEVQHAATTEHPLELRVVSDHFGEELERDWVWCDVLCLPTLSENFGLVVAEALERGKRVIVTDGAPAWALEECGGGEAWRERLLYLKGYREGTDEQRVKLLRKAISDIAVSALDSSI